ncbi:ATP-dependent 6-phosphofructokinase 6 [Capsicum galapagoense]
MVIVIAEGFGQEILATENSHARSEHDSPRNKLPQDVGLWVSHKIRDNSLQVVWSNHADQRRLISMIPCGLNIKREFDSSITVDIGRQIKALCKIIPRQIKAENVVSVIRQIIEELISKCKENVEFEGERINEDEYVNDRDPSILRFFLASREEGRETSPVAPTRGLTHYVVLSTYKLVYSQESHLKLIPKLHFHSLAPTRTESS